MSDLPPRQNTRAPIGRQHVAGSCPAFEQNRSGLSSRRNRCTVSESAFKENLLGLVVRCQQSTWSEMTMPLWRELAVRSSFRRGSAMPNVIKEGAHPRLRPKGEGTTWISVSAIRIVKPVADKSLNKKQRRRHSIMAFEMIRLDRAAAEPLHQQLYRQIRDELISGSFNNSSSRLPSSRALAADSGNLEIHRRSCLFEASCRGLPSVQNWIGHIRRGFPSRNFFESAQAKHRAAR